MVERLLRATFDPRGLEYSEFKGHTVTLRACASRSTVSLLHACGNAANAHLCTKEYFRTEEMGEEELLQVLLAHVGNNEINQMVHIDMLVLQVTVVTGEWRLCLARMSLFLHMWRRQDVACRERLVCVL